MCGGRFKLAGMVGSSINGAAVTSGLRVYALADPTDGGVRAENLAHDLHEGVDVITDMFAGMTLLTSHKPLSYTPLTHSPHTPLSYTPLTHSSHKLPSYTSLIHSHVHAVHTRLSTLVILLYTRITTHF
jgi:hypothetical protein